MPSEKAFAYKMRLDALNKQGSRTDLTFSPMDKKLRNGKEAATELGESQAQIYRYIRLTSLIPDLLDLVDTGKLKLRPAVELSYLDAETQQEVMKATTESGIAPTYGQASRIRKAFDTGELNIGEIMSENMPKSKAKYTFAADKLRPFIPDDFADAETEVFILKALAHYQKYLQRSRKAE